MVPPPRADPAVAAPASAVTGSGEVTLVGRPIPHWRSPRYVGSLLAVSHVASWLTLLIGATVLVGYLFRIPPIVRLAPTLPPMYPNAAVSFVIVGITGLVLRRRRVSVLAVTGGVLVALVGLVGLALHLHDAGRTAYEFLWPAGRPFVEATTPVGGRPVVEALVAFVLLGGAAALMGTARAARTAQALAVGAMTIGVSAVLGYALGVDRAGLGSTIVVVGMALHTGVGLAAGGLAIVTARPAVGALALLTEVGPIARIGRRFVALALLGPLVVAGVSVALGAALSDQRLALSLVTAVEAALIGAMVMIPVMAVERLHRSLAESVTTEQRRWETMLERDPVAAAMAADLEAPLPELADWRVAVRLEPATSELAGDSFQVLRGPSGDALISLVDVAGHGGVPALLAYRLRSSIATMFDLGVPISAMTPRLGALVEQAHSTASAVLLRLDAVGGVVDVVNAGHPPPMLLHSGRVTRWSPTGPVLGVHGARYRVERRRLHRGDMVVLVTDGLTEVRDAQGAQLGVDALIGQIRLRAAEGPVPLVDALLGAALDFGDGSLHDDALALVVERRLGPDRFPAPGTDRVGRSGRYDAPTFGDVPESG